MKLNRLLRKLHFWGALIILLPVVVVIGSGLLLQVKKEVEWVQPASVKGSGFDDSLSTQGYLIAVKQIPELGIHSWQDVERIDIRPSKKIAKVRSHNGYEAQLDLANGQVLKVAKRRSDLIESIHDGSWFHDYAKLWVFLPVAIILFLLWLTGFYMLYITLRNKYRSHHKNR